VIPLSAKSVKQSLKDYYYRKAKQENWAARSVFKLQEIDEKYSLFHTNSTVLDLGCHPGSWLQYITKKSSKGKVIGLDRFSTKPPAENATCLLIDVFDFDPVSFGLKPLSIDVLVSDMAPDTTGIRTTDAARSLALCERALNLALQLLKIGGHFLVKTLQSPDTNDFAAQVRKNFSRVELVRPKATRSASREIYIVGLDRRRN